MIKAALPPRGYQAICYGGALCLDTAGLLHLTATSSTQNTKLIPVITTSLNTTDKKITKRINNNKRSRHLLCFLYQLNQDLIKFPRRNNRIYIQDTLNSILCISIPILLSISDWKLSRRSRWPSTVSRCLMSAQMRIKSPAGTTNCISLYIRQWRQQAANLSVSLEFIRREGEQINYF